MTKGRAAAWAAADAGVAALGMWLATSRRMRFLDAPTDDRLFATLANSIRDGHWLGTYDNLTLAKGQGYPVFMALTSGAGIPLRLAEQAVYLLGCWLVARCIGQLSDRRALGLAAFAIAALNPILWGDSLARIVRENLYAGLTVVVLGLAMRTFLPTGAPRASAARLVWGGLLGASFGWFWLTREEGLWLAPALAVLAAFWMWQSRARQPARAVLRHYGRAALVVVVPCLAFAAVDLGVAAADRRAYGVFETNEFRSDSFRAAYGALSRIEHERSDIWFAVPRDARLKAYAVVPAMRELQPFLEGEVGARWQEYGCSLSQRPCDDIQSGWFMWALRDAAQGAGHYASAPESDRFYRRLAREVNAACDTGQLACLPPRDGFLPPLRRAHLPIIADDAWRLWTLLGQFGDESPGLVPGVGAPDVVQEFRRVARGPWVEPNRADRIDRAGAWNLGVMGWVVASKAPLQVSAELPAGSGGKLWTVGAPDVIRSLGSTDLAAVRFSGIVPCRDGRCPVLIDHDGAVVRVDLAAAQPGSLVAPGGLRLWLDAVAPAQPDVAVHSAARDITVATSSILRSIGVVLLPICALAGVLQLVADTWSRRLRAITVVWAALLAAMGARIALLATLDATSLPAVSPLYLSPAVGPALLLMAGIAGHGVLTLLDHLRARRSPGARA